MMPIHESLDFSEQVTLIFDVARSLANANSSEIYEKQFGIHSKIGILVKYKLVEILGKKYRKKTRMPTIRICRVISTIIAVEKLYSRF